MKVDAAIEVLFEGEQAKRFERERIEHRNGVVEHLWTVVMLGRRFILSVGV